MIQTTDTMHRSAALPDPQSQTDILRAYLFAQRRALLAQVAEIERLLGIKKSVDKR